MELASLIVYINEGGGVCGTCADRATATADNQGYSSCCNDRIEYGEEAIETVTQAACAHKNEKVETTSAFGFRSPDGSFPRTTVSDVVCADCGAYIRDAS